MKQINDWLTNSKLNDMVQKFEQEEKKKNTFLRVLAVIGAVAAVAGIAYVVYKLVSKNEEPDDFDDDFEDDFFDDENDNEDIFEDESSGSSDHDA